MTSSAHASSVRALPGPGPGRTPSAGTASPVPHSPQHRGHSGGSLLRQRAVPAPEAELHTVRLLVTATACGSGGVLIVEGRRGTGKTSVLTRVRDLAGHVGVRALSGAAREEQHAVPFGPLLQAMTDAVPPVGDPRAIRTLCGRADQRFALVHELEAALESAARLRPLTIVLDDLQWADAGTVLAVRWLASQLAHLPILWVLAVRTGVGPPVLRDVLARLVRDGARRMPLALSAESTAVSGRGGSSRSGPVAGWGSLTPAELRVVRLVAAGATNREAADELYLSPHTVSSHLRSAFIKLGLHTRTQLARVVFMADGLSGDRS